MAHPNKKTGKMHTLAKPPICETGGHGMGKPKTHSTEVETRVKAPDRGLRLAARPAKQRRPGENTRGGPVAIQKIDQTYRVLRSALYDGLLFTKTTEGFEHYGLH